MTNEKPTASEDEYFAKEDALKKQKLAIEQAKALAQKERDDLKALHYMRCPKCGMQLQTIKFRGIDIDRCFTCNGTFLDEGELEKLAAPSSGQEGSVIRSVFNIFKK